LETNDCGSRQVRPEIYDSLTAGFGGDSAIFASLWRIPNEHDPIHHESLDEILNDVTPEKGAAFDWTVKGWKLVLVHRHWFILKIQIMANMLD
jgi:hypothetical protein